MLVVTAADDNYAIGVVMLIGSLALNNPGVRVAVLDQGISAERRAQIDALSDRFDVKIQRIEANEALVSSLPIRNAHITSATYLRLLIPDLFPNDEIALYLDCDMLVTDNLSGLFDIDLKENLIGAVPDSHTSRPELDSTGTEPGKYVNAGLMLMNLKAWRSENTAATCLNVLSDPNRKILFEDQSAVNIACKGRIRFLPFRFNTFTLPSAHGWNPGTLQPDPAILHYIGPQKPWKSHCSLATVWHRYAEIIDPTFNVLDLPAPDTTKPPLRKRLSMLNRRRKQFFARLMTPGGFRSTKGAPTMAAIEQNLLARHRNVTAAQEVTR